MVTVTTVAGVQTYGSNNPLIRPVQDVPFDWDEVAGTPGSGVTLVRIPPALRPDGTSNEWPPMARLPALDRTAPPPARSLHPMGSIVLNVGADLEPVTPPAADPVDESVFRHGSAYDDQTTGEESVPDKGGQDEALADEPSAHDEPPSDEGDETSAGGRSAGPEQQHRQVNEGRSPEERDRLERERIDRERDAAAALKRRADRDDRLRRLAEADAPRPRAVGFDTAVVGDVARPVAPLDAGTRFEPGGPAQAAVAFTPTVTSPSAPHPAGGGEASSGPSSVRPERGSVTPSPDPTVRSAEAAGATGRGPSRATLVGGTAGAAVVRAATLRHPEVAVRASAGSQPLDVFTLLRPT